MAASATYTDWVQTLQTAADNLRADFNKYEAFDPPAEELVAVQNVVTVACDEIDTFITTVTSLTDGKTHIVDEKLASAVRTVLRDTPQRAETIVRRELDKLSHSIVGDVGFVFEDDDPSIGEAAVAQVRHQVVDISRGLNVAGDLTQALNDFVENHFLISARAVYNNMVNATIDAAGKKLEERTRSTSAELRNLISNYEPAGTTQTQQPQPPAEALPARPVSVVGGAPPVIPRPQPPVPNQPASRPQSAAESAAPRPPPPVKPRPQTVAIPAGQPYANAPPTQPLPPTPEPLPLEPSVDAGEQTPSPSKGIAGRSGHLMADLNRMLAGPPSKVKRPTMEQSDQDEQEQPPATAETHHVAPEVTGTHIVAEPSEAAHDEEHPPKEEHPVAEAQAEPPHPVVEYSQPSSSTLDRTASKSQKDFAPAGDKSHKEKEKKGGFRNMLSSLTKSRPKVKKGKAGSAGKAAGHEETGEDASQESLPEEVHPREEVHEAPAPSSEPPQLAVAIPESSLYPIATEGEPKPQTPVREARPQTPVRDVRPQTPVNEAQHEVEPTSATSAHEPTPGTPDAESEDGPAPPARPKRVQPTGAMSALASVMRGGTQRRSIYGSAEGLPQDSAPDHGDHRKSIVSDGPPPTPSRASVHFEQPPIDEELRQSPGPGPATRKPSIPRSPMRQSQVLDETVADVPPSPSRVSPPPVRPRMPKPVTSPRDSVNLDDHESVVIPSAILPKPQPTVPSPASRGEPPVSPVPASPADSTHGAAPLPVRPRPPKPIPSFAKDRPASTASMEGRPASQYTTAAAERPQSQYSVAPSERPQSTYSATTDRPLSTVSAAPPSEVSVTGEVEENAAEVQPEAKVPPPRPPKKIPGVFANTHGGLGALAAAMRGGAPPRPVRPASVATDTEEGTPEPMAALEADGEETVSPQYVPPRPQMPTRPTIPTRPLSTAQSETHVALESDEHLDRSESAEPTLASRRPMVGYSHDSLTSSTPLIFKKKEDSRSGDDKAIEKSAIEWLNHNLTTQDTQVEDIYTQLENGLNLIYALEQSTGESVGKYNKRAMLPVHKIDNWSVVLAFLGKKGVDVRAFTPQELMGGDRGKILTLFTYILKTFPL
ncbi:hypothetical protein HK097_006887 [Rhizophlyctis rosea]|uniref:Calponin-homology (CH) domain-containing protein n=1 Tax=Rhizophlyctis rosea TaxID=64517 RepID=A0AAD5SEJ8_9FUNG|nr:hypothetical protein HK097_006887 [Rhizophlyctis rosea]